MNLLFPKSPAPLFWVVAAALFCLPTALSAQTVIGGDTIDLSAMLDVQGTDKGILLPRLSNAQRNAIAAPAKGLLLFNTEENCIQINAGTPLLPLWKCLGEGLPAAGNQSGNILYWNGSAWVRLAPGLPGQQLSLSPQGNPVWTGATFPVVNTLPINTVTHQFVGEVPVFQAVVGGNVSADGGGPLLGKGVVCGTDDNPTFSNAPKSVHVTGLSGVGSYTGPISDLLAGTTYKCRAYAVNSAGTVYGEQQTFTTKPQGTLSGLNCAGATLSADLVAGKSPDGTILTIPYTGGNGGVYAYWATASTGLQGLTASLEPGTLALGAGNLQFALAGSTPTAGTANFNISIGGQSCTVSKAVLPGAIATLNCAGATFSTDLVAGKSPNGTILTIPYTGGNGGSYPEQSTTSTGLTGLTASLAAGTFSLGVGSVQYTITGTTPTTGTASFNISIGGQSCTVSRTVLPAATSPAMKSIPAGSFSMGCTTGDSLCYAPESPVHNVTLSAFQMGETEVTQAQWQAVMGANPSYYVTACPQCPVEQVSWYDALVFCNRLSEVNGLAPCYYADAGFTQVYGKSGGTWSLPNSGEVYRNPTANGYRLPTEAEWEYAARGSSTTNIYSGSNTAVNVAWFGNPGSTQPVRQKSANGYGLYDMSGNVFEWCEDDWHEDYNGAPSTGSAWIDSPRANLRIIRGGSFINPAESCRVSQRGGDTPATRHYSMGFRVVRVP